MRYTSEIAIAVAGLLLSLGSPAAGQSLADRIARAPEGTVRFSYAARPDVCGDDGSIILRDPGDEEKGGVTVIHGEHRGHPGAREWCATGPVRVELRSPDPTTGPLRVRVGSVFAEASGTDLGEVAPQEAAAYLLDLATRAPATTGRRAVLAAALARDAVIVPRLLRLAVSEAVPMETRRNALFWAGHEEAPLDDLRRVYASAPGSLREHMTFVYSQRDDPEAARELLRIARDAEESQRVRKRSVFWLGQIAQRSITRDLGEMAHDGSIDVEVREQAVFALSQRPAGEGVPALIQIVRENPDPRLRRKAIFWLGQSGDPRAISLFQELLGIR